MSQGKPQLKPKVRSATPLADALAERHLSLVGSVARDIHKKLPPSVAIEDLVGAGNIGLLEAARRFDPMKRVLFTTFARHRIRGAITDSLRLDDSISRGLRAEQKKAERAFSELTLKFGRPPSEAEVAARLGIPVTKWRKLHQQLHDAGCGPDGFTAASRHSVSLDAIPGRWLDPERQAELSGLRSRVRNALRMLPARERNIIRLHDFEEWTLKRIGERLGVNESRVSQLRCRALGRLKAELVGERHPQLT